MNCEYEEWIGIVNPIYHNSIAFPYNIKGSTAIFISTSPSPTVLSAPHPYPWAQAVAQTSTDNQSIRNLARWLKQNNWARVSSSIWTWRKSTKPDTFNSSLSLLPESQFFSYTVVDVHTGPFPLSRLCRAINHQLPDRRRPKRPSHPILPPASPTQINQQ